MVKFEMIRSVVFMVKVLVLMELASTSVVASKAGVYVFHDIEGPDPLQVKCTKGSGYWAYHLPPQKLQFQQRHSWDFNPSVWGTTKYYYTFGWGSITKEVRVWTELEWLPHWKPIPRPCLHCLWHVKGDGLYSQSNDTDKPDVSVFVAGWQ